jgi:SAM-dependent methyltransferase
MRLPTTLRTLLKKAFATAGYELTRIGSKGLGYISADEVQKKAKSKNLSVNQYLEEIWNLETHASRIINSLELDKFLSNAPYNVLEIGAGTGVYTDKLITKLGLEHIQLYQIYETSQDWVNYLRTKYPVELPKANGYLLNSTESASINLAHAHGVFVYTSFVTTISYMREMIRVVKKGGIVAFDILNQNSCTDSVITSWINEEKTYFNIVHEEYISDLFLKNGFREVKKFQSEIEPGSSTYYIYLRDA